MSWLEAAHREIASFTPKPGGGFNVVGVDDFEPPGERLYLVGNYATRKAAETAARRHQRRSGDRAYVYAPPVDPVEGAGGR